MRSVSRPRSCTSTPDRVDAGDARAHPQLDPEMRRSSRAAARERLCPNVASGSLPPSTMSTRTDCGSKVRKSPRSAARRELADLARDLDAGRAGADDDDGQPLALLLRHRSRSRPSRTRRRSGAAARARRRSSSCPARTARTRRGRSTTGWRRRRRSGCRRGSPTIAQAQLLGEHDPAVEIEARRPRPARPSRSGACAARGATAARSGPGERMPVATWYSSGWKRWWLRRSTSVTSTGELGRGTGTRAAHRSHRRPPRPRWVTPCSPSRPRSAAGRRRSARGA